MYTHSYVEICISVAKTSGASITHINMKAYTYILTCNIVCMDVLYIKHARVCMSFLVIFLFKYARSLMFLYVLVVIYISFCLLTATIALLHTHYFFFISIF